MSATDLLELFGRFAVLSMLSVGGVIAVAPEMHRIVVSEHGWITDGQFSASIALAQAAPGPNALFVTLIGWNAGGWPGALAATTGILLPSSVMALAAHRFTARFADLPWVRAFRAGMAPITIGLLAATGWILADHNADSPALLALAAVSAVVLTLTRINPLWMILAGAVIGIAIGA